MDALTSVACGWSCVVPGCRIHLVDGRQDILPIGWNVEIRFWSQSLTGTNASCRRSTSPLPEAGMSGLRNRAAGYSEDRGMAWRRLHMRCALESLIARGI